jgi:hypothetical protein
LSIEAVVVGDDIGVGDEAKVSIDEMSFSSTFDD